MKATAKQTTFQPLHEIAALIRKDWQNVYFGAKPYLAAMAQCSDINDPYGCEDARTQVMYFLANANTWRGDVARETKKTLNAMLKLPRK